MVTGSELLRVALVPALVALALGAVGRWRRWPWMMPLAAGTGFMLGYALKGAPNLPPRDGIDWVFWLAPIVTGLGILDGAMKSKWGWLLGAAAGAVALVVVWPLPPETVARREVWMTSLLMAGLGIAVSAAAGKAQASVSPWAVTAAMSIVTAAAAVVIMSSHLRIVGVYAIAAAASLASVAAMMGRLPAGRAVAIVATCLMAGLLAGGHYYPDEGVTWKNWIVLMLAPALVVAGTAVPSKRPWLKAIAALLPVSIATAAVTVPTALAAKKAADAAANDPYADYYKSYP